MEEGDCEEGPRPPRAQSPSLAPVSHVSPPAQFRGPAGFLHRTCGLMLRLILCDFEWSLPQQNGSRPCLSSAPRGTCSSCG